MSFAPEVSPQVDPTRLPVLVVEDNRETLFIYEKYLKGSGFQVIPARSVRAARRVLKELRPVAVVLDISAGGGEHLGADRRPEAHGRRRTTFPVWVVTMVDNQHKARALGADDFCVKPVDRAWLLDSCTPWSGRREREKVLVIDDDEVSRYLLQGLLADTRFAVMEAADGAEGLRLAAQEQPRAVFLDLDMPGLTGFEVLEAPAVAGRRPEHIPVIIHTSKVLDGRRTPPTGRRGGDPVQGIPIPRRGPGAAAGGPRDRAGLAADAAGRRHV